jgi:hypothetical protein
MFLPNSVLAEHEDSAPLVPYTSHSTRPSASSIQLIKFHLNATCPLSNVLKFKTPGLVNMTVFWDVAPCSPVDTDRRFGDVYYVHQTDE